AAAPISALDADKVSDALDDLPLALTMAASWLSTTGTSVDEYVAQLAEARMALSTERPASKNGIVATVELTMSRLSPDARALLCLISYFGDEPISIRLLGFGRSIGADSPVKTVLDDEIHLRRTVRELGRFGLIRVDDNTSITLHRLFRASVRDQLSP